jgi:hypothetical protein
MTPAQQIALWADKLRDHAAQGLRFAANVYERGRWTQIQRWPWKWSPWPPVTLPPR